MRKILYYVTVLIILFTITISTASLITDTEWGYLKMLDFGRLQIFIGGLLAMLAFIVITKKWKWYDYGFILLLLLALGFQLFYLIHYSPLVPKVVADSTKQEHDLSVLVFNLYLENEEYDAVVKLLENVKADVVLTLENTSKWQKALEPLKSKYPYTTKTINTVGYGMTIYSKYELQNLQQYYLHNEQVPSYGFDISLEDGNTCKIYTLHPPPPRNYANIPDNSGQKEKELTIIGDKIAKDDMPVILMGDLNDVAWGKTERLVKAKGKLRDIRVGRGMYSSFSAHSWWMKWPLDHVFVTDDFLLHKLELLDNCGSDHYPVYAELTFK